MAGLTLYSNPMSRGRIARWMLEEVGQPYDVEMLAYADSMKSPDYLKINPMGKVPAIRHGDTVVTETAAICAYLADAFPEAGLAPAARAAERGPYYRWLFYAAGPIETAVTTRVLGWTAPPDKQRMAGWGSFEQVMDTLDHALAEVNKDEKWLAGDRFSAADVYVGAQVNFGLAFGTVDKRASFERFAERVQARPAYKRASELDDAAMPKQD